MKIADLSPQTFERLKKWRYDSIVEKHEGPWDYAGVFTYGNPEFMEINGKTVLLPLDGKQRPNVTILRCVESKDGNVLTIFLKDTTFVENPQHEFLEAGFRAICEKFPGEEFFVATVYHEWFMETNEAHR